MHIFSTKVEKREIHDEIEDGMFRIIIDKACDVSKKEQTAIVLMFVNKNSFLQENFFWPCQYC